MRPQLYSPRLLRVIGRARRVALIRPCPPPLSIVPTPHGQKLVIFRDSGWKGGRPLFRDLKVMQLNSDSFCDYVRIWMEVIGHLWAELGFWFFSEKRVKISAAANISTFFLGKLKNLTRLISVLSLPFKFVHNHKSYPNSAPTILSL